MQFLIWIISGIIAGWLAGLLVKGKGFGLMGDLVIGLLGGFVGGWLDFLVCKPLVGWVISLLLLLAVWFLSSSRAFYARHNGTQFEVGKSRG